MKRMIYILLIFCPLIGCGADEFAPQSKHEAAHETSGADADTRLAALDSSDSTVSATIVGGESTADRTVADAGQRQIIYSATIDLVVKKLQETESQIKSLVKESQGYVSEFNQDRRYGDQLQSRWVVRIPVARFDTFVDAVAELGIPESRNIESQEVTKQFRDLTARLKNKKRTEQEFQKLLAEQTKTIDDIASIAEKLDKVRENIELIEGDLRFLNDRIALTTVTISAREDKDYTPPQAPSFGTRLSETFGDSIGTLVSFGKGCLLFCVAIAPWLPIILIVVVMVWFKFFRRRRRRVTQTA